MRTATRFAINFGAFTMLHADETRPDGVALAALDGLRQSGTGRFLHASPADDTASYSCVHVG